jgi:uncharacterized membrane protein YkvA (DUF1232 family)
MSRYADRLVQWARHIKRDTLAIYFAARHPETPLLARCLAICVAAYALSPIDLIPDFIPVFGLLDDLIIVPLGLAIVLRMVPPRVMDDSRDRATRLLEKPTSRVAALVIVAIWLIALGVLSGWAYRYFAH